jgi:hypothetical protein
VTAVAGICAMVSSVTAQMQPPSSYLADNGVTVGAWTLRSVLSPAPAPDSGIVSTRVLAIAWRGTYAQNVVAILYEQDGTGGPGWQARAWDSSDRSSLAGAIASELDVKNPWEVSSMLGLGTEIPGGAVPGMVELRDFYKGLFEDDPLNVMLADGEHRAFAIDLLTDAGYASANSALELADTFKHDLLNWLTAQSLAQFELPGRSPNDRQRRVFNPDVRPPLPPMELETLSPSSMMAHTIEDVSPVVCGPWFHIMEPADATDQLGFAFMQAMFEPVLQVHASIPGVHCCRRNCYTQRRRTSTKITRLSTGDLIREHFYSYQVVGFEQRCCMPQRQVTDCAVVPPQCNPTATPAIPTDGWTPLPSDEPQLPVLIPEPPRGPMPA